MKELVRQNSPGGNIEFRFQSTTPPTPQKSSEPPKYETPKVTFPTDPIRTDGNTRRNEKGKNTPKKKKPKGQATLWPF